MIKHIVLWQFADEADGHDKAANVERAVAALEVIRGQIPGMVAFEVVRPQPGLEATADLALYSEFVDETALQAYLDHPDHKALAALLGRVRIGRHCVDYDPTSL